MPIFEFQCKTCRSEFKTLRRTEKLAEVTCPDCGDDRVVRLLSVTARQTTSTGPEADDCGRPGGCCRMSGGCGFRN